MKFTEIICRTPCSNKPNKNGIIMPTESIKNACGCENLPFIDRDSPAGIIKNIIFDNENNQVLARGFVWANIADKIKEGYTFVPEIKVNNMDGQIVKDFEFMGFFLTNEPAIDSYTEIGEQI